MTDNRKEFVENAKTATAVDQASNARASKATSESRNAKTTERLARTGLHWVPMISACFVGVALVAYLTLGVLALLDFNAPLKTHIIANVAGNVGDQPPR